MWEYLFFYTWFAYDLEMDLPSPLFTDTSCMICKKLFAANETTVNVGIKGYIKHWYPVVKNAKITFSLMILV